MTPETHAEQERQLEKALPLSLDQAPSSAAHTPEYSPGGEPTGAEPASSSEVTAAAGSSAPA
eukprot:5041105-Alexandrium_andersonii.AAC.1